MDAPRLPASVEALVERLHARGSRVWAVGGAVRDAALGRATRARDVLVDDFDLLVDDFDLPVDDFDLLVDAPFSEILEILPEARRVGRREPILLAPATGERPRVEIASLAERGRSLEEDLAKREFTVNALAFDLERRTWCDPTGGLADLRARVLRAVDPEHTLRSDPVRILRGLRLAQERSLTPEDATRRAMELESWRLALAPGERLRQELFRILRLARPAAVLDTARGCGALSALLPELCRGPGVLRPGASRDVYREALWLCDRLSPAPLLRLAALLRCAAVGDAKRYLRRSRRFALADLERHATALVPPLARRLRLSRRESAGLAQRIRHARPVAVGERGVDDRALRRMLERVGRDVLDEVLELQGAEHALRDPAGEPPARWRALEARIRHIALEREAARLAVSGKDVMRVLGIENGPEVGRWLQRLRWRVVERPEENERARLLAWLERAARA